MLRKLFCVPVLVGLLAGAGVRPATSSGGRPTRALLIILDGMNADDLYWALDQGFAPHLQRALVGGIRAQRAYVGFPSFTGPMHTAAVTGAWPVRSGLIGNTYYERSTGRTVSIFGDLNRNLPYVDEFLSRDAVTLYEALERENPKNVTVAAGEFMDRGADRSYWDGYRRPLPPYGPEDVPFPDRMPVSQTPFLPLEGAQPEAYLESSFGMLTETQFDAHMAHFGAASAGDFDVMVLWQVQTDGSGEMYGPHTRKYIEMSVRNVDANLGDLFGAMVNTDTLDDTLIVVAADHGMRKLNAGAEPAVSIPDTLRAAGETSFVESGTAQGVWLTSPHRDELPSDDGAFGRRVQRAAHALLSHEQVPIVAYWTDADAARRGTGTIRLLGEGGGAGEIAVRDRGEHVRDAAAIYTVVAAPDPLGQRACYAEVLPAEEPRGPAAASHCAPVGEDWPDAVTRLLGLLLNPRAPDVVYSRSGIIDHGAGGTHGELDWEVSRIPLIVAGPGSGGGRSDVPVRVVDIAPTILRAMGKTIPAEMDGEPHCELLSPGIC